MRALIGAALLAALVAGPGSATTADPAAPVRAFIDAFNKGDMKAAFSTYARGVPIGITDEFAPHIWEGLDAPQRWAADYDRHARATGVSNGHVAYGLPSHTVGKAVVTLPTVYTYTQHGVKMAEEGSISTVVRQGSTGWKMVGWTWSGAKPHPAK